MKQHQKKNIKKNEDKPRPFVSSSTQSITARRQKNDEGTLLSRLKKDDDSLGKYGNEEKGESWYDSVIALYSYVSAQSRSHA